MGISNRKFFAGALLVSAVLAGGVSYYASSAPDGLEKVAGDIGFLETAQEHAAENSVLAGYGVKGVENARVSGGAAGIIGVVVTGLVGSALFTLIRRKAKS